MTSNGSRFQDESFTVAAKSPHFYHIILETTTPEKLIIPSKFVKEDGDCLSSPVILKVPTGASWQVELSKNGDEIWLEKSWQEFSMHHNLKHGHFLVFQYKGENHFHVFIFDMSAVEIQYKYNESEDDISCQILDDLTSDDGVDKVEDSHRSIQEPQGKLKDCIDNKRRGSQGGRASCPNACGNLEAANSFISNNPHLKIVFKHKIQSNVSIPFSSIQGNMKCESQKVMLQVADKSWPVKLNVYSHNSTAILSAGWPAFARENSLNPRDVCIFELIMSNVMPVSIFKYGNIEEIQNMTSNGSRFQDARISTHFYRIILERTIPQKKLGIPSKFAKNYGDRLSSPVILKVPTGASWQVELSKNGDEIWLEKGWQEFSVYHNLKHGHFLVFQYKGDNHFHVLIFDMSAVEILYKYNENEDHISCQILDDLTSADDDVEEIEDSHCSTQESQGELKDTTDENSRGKEARRASCSNTCGNLEAANSFISNYPHFKIVLKHRYHVSVPFSFVRGNMKCKSQTVMLQVAGKSWPVKLNVHSDKRFALLTAGWSAFASENSLQPGDVCIFELIKNNVLNASIFKYGG